jgi:hypothetical protein
MAHHPGATTVSFIAKVWDKVFPYFQAVSVKHQQYVEMAVWSARTNSL